MSLTLEARRELVTFTTNRLKAMRARRHIHKAARHIVSDMRNVARGGQWGTYTEQKLLEMELDQRMLEGISEYMKHKLFYEYPVADNVEFTFTAFQICYINDKLPLTAELLFN